MIQHKLAALAAVVMLLAAGTPARAQEFDPNAWTVDRITSTGADLLTPSPAVSTEQVIPEDAPEVTDDAVSEDAVESAYDPLDIGFAQVGKPYIYGSAGGRSDFSPWARGFDCSGFVSYVERVGYDRFLPASTALAYRVTYAVKTPERGDIVFWNMRYSSPRLQHMALYLGDGTVLQSGGRYGRVNVDSAWGIGTPEFRRMY